VSIRWLLRIAAPMLVALGAGAPVARASTPLRVSAPDACATAPALERAVAAHVGRAVALDGVIVSIRPVPGAWRAQLLTGAGARQLDAESCEAALDAVALVLALAVEPEPSSVPAGPELSPALLDPVARTDAAAPAHDARPPNGPATSADRRTQPRARSGTRVDGPALGLGAGVLGEVGVLPAPSLGARLAIGVGWRAWRLELAGLALLPRRAELATNGGQSARIGWWAAQLAACRRVIGAFEGCVGSELGELSGEGSGVDAPRAAHGTWFAETLGAAFSSPWPSPSGPWSWQLGSSLALAVVRPEFGFDGLGVLHRPSPISGRLWLAIDWR
jgi:hypothetical protein